MQFVHRYGNISEYKLKSNGLKVILAQQPQLNSPVVTLMIRYNVGSRNEYVGCTGSAHILEHQMFKGSKNFDKKTGTKDIWETLNPLGAHINATTSKDRTNFFETLPLQHLETAMMIEADRMENALIRAEDKNSEMTVVRNEYENGENSPEEAIYVNSWAMAYKSHPYHSPVIGWKDDIENVPIEVLHDFYKKYYNPENAAVIVSGKFNLENVVQLILKHFGPLTRNKSKCEVNPDGSLDKSNQKSTTVEEDEEAKRKLKVYTFDGDQQGMRSYIIKKAGIATSILCISFKKPPSNTPEALFINMVGRLLGDGKKSVFYKKFVKSDQIFTSVDVQNESTVDPGLIQFYFKINSKTVVDIERDFIKVVNIIMEEIQSYEISDSETASIKKTCANDLDIETFTSSMQMADFINEYESIGGDWKVYIKTKKQIEDTTTESLKNALEKYFRPEFSTNALVMNSEKKIEDPSTMSYISKSKDSNLQMIVALPDENIIKGGDFNIDKLPLIDAFQIPQIGDKIEISLIDLEFTTKIKREKDDNSLFIVEKKMTFYKYTVENGVKVNLLFFFPIGPYALKQKNPNIDIEKLKLVVEFVEHFLKRGSDKYSSSEIESILEETDSMISFDFDDYYCYMYVVAKDENLSKILKMAFEMLFFSKYEMSDFNEIGALLKQSIEDARKEPSPRAKKVLSRQLYPKEHRKRIIESENLLKILKNMVLDDIYDGFAIPNLRLTNYFKVIKVGAPTTFECDTIIQGVLVQIEHEALDKVLGDTTGLNLKTKFFIETNDQKETENKFDLGLALQENSQEKITKERVMKGLKIQVDEKTSTTLLIGQRIDLSSNEKNMDMVKDKIYLEIAVYILGGEFTSRLMEQIRVKRGLTYGIYASIDNDDYSGKGHVNIKGTFAPTNLDTGLKETLKVVQDWVQNGITKEELENTKKFFTANYQVGMEQSTTVLQYVKNALCFERGLDYYYNRVKIIQNVSLETVNSVIQKYLNKDSFVVIRSGTLVQ